MTAITSLIVSTEREVGLAVALVEFGILLVGIDFALVRFEFGCSAVLDVWSDWNRGGQCLELVAPFFLIDLLV